MNSDQKKCPHCGCPHCAGATAAQEGGLGWPSKGNREKINAEIQKMSQAMTDGFKKIFHPDLWK